MKKVLLEMEKLNNPNSGLGQFCSHLGASISEIKDNQIEPYFFVPAPKDLPFGNSNYIKSNKLYRYLRLRENFDIWHCLHQESPYLPSDKNTKAVITIHDLNFLTTQKSKVKINHKIRKIQRLIDRASAITVISNFVAEDVKKNFNIGDKPIKVIYNGCSLNNAIKEQKPDFIQDEKFLFSIGIISPKKNFHVLVPMLEYLKEYKLIIAGNNSHSYTNEIIELASKHGVQERILLTGPVSEATKAWLYNHCDAFVFPSLAEGFGLPVIEAMSVGKPVFLSTSTSLPEIGGPEAFYFNNFIGKEMASIVQQGLDDYKKDNDKKNRLINWTKQFSWDFAAQQYIELYKSL